MRNSQRSSASSSGTRWIESPARRLLRSDFVGARLRATVLPRTHRAVAAKRNPGCSVRRIPDSGAARLHPGYAGCRHPGESRDPVTLLFDIPRSVGTPTFKYAGHGWPCRSELTRCRDAAATMLSARARRDCLSTGTCEFAPARARQEARAVEPTRCRRDHRVQREWLWLLSPKGK